MSKLDDAVYRRYSQGLISSDNFADAANLSRKFVMKNDKTFGELLRHLPPKSEVLEIACGAGGFLKWLAGYKNISPVGIDLAESQVALAKSCAPELTVLLGDARNLLRQNCGRFTGIFALSFIEHLNQDDSLEMLQLARNALAEGGFFVFLVPNASSLVGGHTRYVDITHKSSFTVNSCLQLLEAAGYKNNRVGAYQFGHFTGKFRNLVERVLHELVYGACSVRSPLYDVEIYGIGYKLDAQQSPN